MNSVNIESASNSSERTVADPGYTRRGMPTPGSGAKKPLIRQLFAENCIKLKEFKPKGGILGAAPVERPVIKAYGFLVENDNN